MCDVRCSFHWCILWTLQNTKPSQVWASHVYGIGEAHLGTIYPKKIIDQGLPVRAPNPHVCALIDTWPKLDKWPTLVWTFNFLQVAKPSLTWWDVFPNTTLFSAPLPFLHVRELAYYEVFQTLFYYHAINCSI